jgi:hypothetical protein
MLMPYKDPDKQREAVKIASVKHREKKKDVFEALTKKVASLEDANPQNKNALSTSFMEKVGNEINQKKKEEETKTE